MDVENYETKSNKLTYQLSFVSEDLVARLGCMTMIRWSMAIMADMSEIPWTDKRYGAKSDTDRFEVPGESNLQFVQWIYDVL